MINKTIYVEYERESKYAKPGADTSNDHTAFKDAGVQLLDEDVVVDIDDLDTENGSIEELIKILDIKTQIVYTDRGIHLYYTRKKTTKKDRASWICPLGFKVEYKTKDNCKDITIKRNGVMRNIENEGEREELPEILNPNRINMDMDSLVGHGEGDLRNNSLFKTNAGLISNGIDDNMRLKILNFINDYVFAEPLDPKEFETVSRKLEVSDEEETAYDVAEKLQRILKPVYYSNELYILENDEYRLAESPDNPNGLMDIVKDNCMIKRLGHWNEVYGMFKIGTDGVKKYPIDSEFDIKLNNGFLQGGDFIEVNTTDFSPFNIDINYIEDAEIVPEVDKFFRDITQNDKDIEQLLYEIIASCFIVDKSVKRELGKFFFLQGGGNNGKSTYIKLIKEIVQVISASKPTQLKDERYLYGLHSKLANIGDDIESKAIDEEVMDKLKNIATADTIEIRQLYSQSITTTIGCTMVFGSNHKIKSFEKTDAYKRRVVWIPFNHKITEKIIGFDDMITSKKALEYIMSKVVASYYKLYETREYISPIKVEQFTDVYHLENNTCLQFLMEHEAEELHGVKPGELYDEYEIWIEENGLDPSSKKMLAESVKEHFNMESVNMRCNGIQVRGYQLNED